MTPPARRTHVCIVAEHLKGGGAERVTITWLRGLAEDENFTVDLILLKHKGALLPLIPDGVRLFTLDWKYFWRRALTPKPSLPRMKAAGIKPLRLARAWLRDSRGKSETPPGATPYLSATARLMADYLDAEKPDVVVPVLIESNLVALLGRREAGYKPRIISSIRNTVASISAKYTPLVAALLPEADLVHVVSKGIADDFISKMNLNQEKVVTLHNPVFRKDLEDLKREPLPRSWREPQDGAKTIITIGTPGRTAKDHETLLRAFRIVTEKRKARLIVLGDGHRKKSVERLADELGIQVLLPGFVQNPFPWLIRSDLFVLSSRWEGLPGVLIEALACGVAVVSTDCPHGPREILQDGRFGKLVPVGSPEKLAAAINQTLDNPPNADELIARAKDFSEEAFFPRYQAMLDKALDAAQPGYQADVR